MSGNEEEVIKNKFKLERAYITKHNRLCQMDKNYLCGLLKHLAQIAADCNEKEEAVRLPL